MLESLSARGFVLIDSLRMDFSSGFVALTGETGAGKSLLVDALSLLRGGRARPDLARDGGAAEVEAVFDISARPDARARLAAAGLCDSETASEPLVVRRVVAADGKSRAFINGRAATIGQLREIVGEIVEICGQRAHHSLLQAAAQRDLIDDFAAARDEREIRRRRLRPLARLRSRGRGGGESKKTNRVCARSKKKSRRSKRWIFRRRDGAKPTPL